MSQLFRQLVEWIGIPSVTGSESDYGDALARALERAGFAVERQSLPSAGGEPRRFNVLARAGAPEVVFCTHLDTVPPYFGATEDAEFIHGRGACDAKGPAAAMLAAAQKLLEDGEDRIGLLFTVGEETDSAGATLANARLADPWRPRFVVVGEPTGNRFVRSSKGILKGHLVATGRAGHSSTGAGPSAVHELVQCLHRLLQLDWGDHPRLGRGSLNIGQMEGGIAANVIAESAQARIMLRLVDSPELAERRIREQLGEHVRLDTGSKSYGPIEYELPLECDPIDVAFGTDVPHLPRFGRPLLYGPGRIADAHSAEERVSKASLLRSCDDYERLARELFARIDAGVS